MIERFRDHAANERTYLAWVRTAVTVMGFGLVVARLDVPASAPSGMPPLSYAGLGLVIVGTLVIIASSIRFMVLHVRIRDPRAEGPPGLLLDLLLGGVMVLLLGAIALYSFHLALS